MYTYCLIKNKISVLFKLFVFVCFDLFVVVDVRPDISAMVHWALKPAFLGCFW